MRMATIILESERYLKVPEMFIFKYLPIEKKDLDYMLEAISS